MRGKGALWNAHRRHYGHDGDEVLVWQADTRSMNPSVPQSYIDRHIAEDAARAAAEYLAQFRSDLEAFVLREAVEACISVGVRERPPIAAPPTSASSIPAAAASTVSPLRSATATSAGRL